jgi:dihydropyrimidinase
MTIRELAKVGSYNTARRFGMYPRKGTLLPGSDADLVLVDPDREWTVRAAEDLSYSDFSIFEGRRMRGAVDLTAVRGQVLYENGKLVGGPGRGLYLNRFNTQGGVAETREAALA